MEGHTGVVTAAICEVRCCSIIPPLTLYKRKIMRWNFSELVTFYLCGLCALTPVRAALIVFVHVAALSRGRGSVLLFTVCSHQPFPISPSGKSQLFVQVPSVIEFAAEIAAWKISFSLPEGGCVWVWVSATQCSLPPIWSTLSSISKPTHCLQWDSSADAGGPLSAVSSTFNIRCTSAIL